MTHTMTKEVSVKAQNWIVQAFSIEHTTVLDTSIPLFASIIIGKRLSYLHYPFIKNCLTNCHDFIAIHIRGTFLKNHVCVLMET